MFANTNNTTSMQSSAAPLPTLAQIMAGGTPSAFQKEDPIGTSVQGNVESVDAQQQRDFDSGEPKYWQNGQPMMQIVIHAQTGQIDPSIAGDDGVRAIYIKGRNIANLRSTCQKVGRDAPHVGDGFRATYSANGEATKRGYNPPKLYAYELQPNAASISQTMDSTGQQAGNATQQRPAQLPLPQAQQAHPAMMQPQFQPAVNVSQVQALQAAGNTPAQIAGMLAVPVETIQQALQAAAIGGEPEF